MLKQIQLAVLIATCAALFGCGHNDPVSVTKSFIDASNRGDKETAESLFTRLARENVRSGKGDGVSITKKDPVTNKDRKWDDYSVGSATVEGDNATVPVSTKSAEKQETVKFKLRREEGAWKIYAFAFPIETAGQDITLDLEHPERFAGEVLKILPTALGEGLKTLGDAFTKAGNEISNSLGKPSSTTR